MTDTTEDMTETKEVLSLVEVLESLTSQAQSILRLGEKFHKSLLIKEQERMLLNILTSAQLILPEGFPFGEKEKIAMIETLLDPLTFLSREVKRTVKSLFNEEIKERLTFLLQGEWW